MAHFLLKTLDASDIPPYFDIIFENFSIVILIIYILVNGSLISQCEEGTCILYG